MIANLLAKLQKNIYFCIKIKRKMQEIVQKMKKYPVSVMYIIAIWVLCFMDVPETPLSDVSLIDKWAHVAMYLGTCLMIIVEYVRTHDPRCISWRRIIVWAGIMPALMSGVIELGQAYCTGGRRSGEWLDFLANSVGCALALVVGCVFICMRLRKIKK